MLVIFYTVRPKAKKRKKMFPLGLEPRTFRVLGGCDNHYTTETAERLVSLIVYELITQTCRCDLRLHLGAHELTTAKVT